MENLVFTQLSVQEIKILFRQELEDYFADKQQQTKSEDYDSFMSIQQAAEFLKLSVPTIYGLVSRTEIPYSKKGKRLYFSKQELLEWVQSGRRKTNAEIAEQAAAYCNNHKNKRR